MRTIIWLGIVATVLIMAPREALAQSGVIKFDYQDPSQRKTRRTDREDKQKKAADEAKKKADEDRRQKERADRQKRWEEDRNRRNGNSSDNKNGTTTAGGSRQTTGSRTASRGPRTAAGKAASAPVTKGDSTLREVNEVMLDATKTQLVKFDASEAREDPSVILLNAPKFDPEQRKRAADSSNIAQPL